MASKFTKIPRAIEEFKLFLKYNDEEYEDAFKYIKKSEGWNIPYYDDEIYSIVSNLYHNLYEEIYPKLVENNPCSDTEIINSFKGTLILFEQEYSVFEKIINKKRENKEDEILGLIEGQVHTLIYKAILKLQEIIQLSEEDNIRYGKTSQSNNNYLIGIITATSEEFKVVKSKLNNVTQLPTSNDDSQVYYDGIIQKDDKRIKVILTQSHHQGTAAASTTTTKLIFRFKPNLVVMLGHAAGNKNLLNLLNLGDILICSESVNYDQVIVTQKNAEIKEKDKKVTIEPDATLLRLIEDFASEQSVLCSIKESSRIKSFFSHPLKYKLGKLISGDALVRSEEWFTQVISDNSGTIGLDMETYGVYYSAKYSVFKDKPDFISIKSVSDFGSHKNYFSEELKHPQNRVAYAIHTSVEFFFRFAIENLPM